MDRGAREGLKLNLGRGEKSTHLEAKWTEEPVRG
jgi:hypothetical protein